MKWVNPGSILLVCFLSLSCASYDIGDIVLSELESPQALPLPLRMAVAWAHKEADEGVRLYIWGGSHDGLSSVELFELAVNVRDQYASNVTFVSSSWGEPTDWRNNAPLDMTGYPDAILCTDIPGAWTPGTKEDIPHVVEVQYAYAVYPTAVALTESLNAGFVQKVEIGTEDRQFFLLWEGEDDTSSCPGLLVINIPDNLHQHLVKYVRMTTQHTGWEGLDAVELRGTTPERISSQLLTPERGDQHPNRAARSTVAGSADGRWILTWGGTTEHYAILNRVYAYELLDKEWHELLPEDGFAPPGRTAARSIFDDEKRRLLVLFGYSESGDDEVIWQFDVETYHWSSLDCRFEDRYEPGMAQAGSIVYFYGGLTSSGGYSADLLSFHLDSDTCHNVTVDLKGSLRPPALWDPILVYWGECAGASGCLVLLSGYGTNPVDFRDVWFYDIAEGLWDKREAIDPPMRYGGALTHVSIQNQGQLFYFGAVVDDYSEAGHPSDLVGNKVFSLNLTSLEWRKVPDKPPARWGHSLVSYDGALWIYAGETFSKQALGDLWKLTLRDHQEDSGNDAFATEWREIVSDTGSPPARSRHAYAMVGRTLCVHGGTADGRIFSDLWAINLLESSSSSLMWYAIQIRDDSPIPPARASHRMEVVENSFTSLVIFGGIGEHGLLNDMWRFDTSKEVWELLRPCEDGGLPPARAGYIMLRDYPYDSQTEVTVTGLIVIAGTDEDTRTVYTDAWRMDWETQCWERVDTSNIPYLGAEPVPLLPYSQYAAMGSEVIVFGGMIASQGMFPTISPFVSRLTVHRDGPNGTYYISGKVLGQGTSARSHGAAVVDENMRFLVFGGSIDRDTDWPVPLNDVLIMNLQPVCSYNTWLKDEDCFPCREGLMYRFNGECSSCRRGEVQPEVGRTGCYVCPGGLVGYVEAGKSWLECQPCPPGHISVYEFMSGYTCIKCSADEYCPPGVSSPVDWDYADYSITEYHPKELASRESDVRQATSLYGYGLLSVMTVVLLVILAFWAHATFFDSGKVVMGEKTLSIVRRLDFFRELHIDRPSIPSSGVDSAKVVVRYPTVMGGFLCIVFLFGIAIVFGNLAIPYFLDNTYELRSVVTQSSQKTAATIWVYVSIPGFESCQPSTFVHDGLSSRQSTAEESSKRNIYQTKNLDGPVGASFVEESQNADDNTYRECLEEQVVATGFSGDMSYTCFANEDGCHVAWVCNECELTSAIARVSISYLSALSSAYAIDFKVEAESGLPDQRSVVSGRLVPTEAGALFRGEHPTRVALHVVDTVYRNEANLTDGAGYHIRYNDWEPGSMLDFEEYPMDMHVYVDIELQRFWKEYLIVVYNQETFVQVASSLLSAFTGLMRLMGVVLVVAEHFRLGFLRNGLIKAPPTRFGEVVTGSGGR
eukprot:Rmarinus@m.5564